MGKSKSGGKAESHEARSNDHIHDRTVFSISFANNQSNGSTLRCLHSCGSHGRPRDENQ
jgi:hypothetical protein